MVFRQPGPNAPPRGLLRILLLALPALWAVDAAVRLAVEFLWFEEVGAASVFKARLGSQFGFGVAGFVVALVAVGISLWWAWRHSPRPLIGPRGETLMPVRAWRALAWAAGLLFAVFSGMLLAANWLDFRLALSGVAYGKRDPIFAHDIGFYLFRLPALRHLVAWITGVGFGVVIMTGLGYAARNALMLPRGGLARNAARHLGILGAILIGLLAVQIWLSQYDILLSPTGVVYGPGWSDVHARLPGTRLAAVAALAAAILFGIGAWRLRRRLVTVALVGFAALWLLLVAIIPGLLQKLVVEPNELVKEKSYIEQAIGMTREAYDLDGIAARPFDLDRGLDAATLTKHRDVLENIRLWDWRPLLATYSQIQEIRLYYNFGDVDIDRYVFGSQYRQVMLSARELAYDQIPESARTWVNLHQRYTHGYGLCMSPVNRITPEGLPELWVRDIPPVSSVDLQIRRPEIYFGEQTTAFALVGTSTDEFDYPLGETNQSTRYSGRGGIGIGSFGRRLLFAWYLRSREMLLTSYLQPESRILMRRTLRDRVQRIAPFLRYDQDPYLVVYDGRLVWIQDAYTTSARFPSSSPVGGLNYIRNAVKIVMDAYDGTTQFFAAAPNEPLLRAHAAVFPGLFQPIDAMPAGLRAHLRYPEDLFEIQAESFATFHMQDPQVFYNREDLWARPIESAGGQERGVEPYYTIMRLPDEERPELVLMLPFTPARKDNMVAWMVARCDGEHLGERQVYLFPKQELVYGPRQIEARIDQDAVISQQLTLWSQHGSNVIRGNLLVLPIERSLLYVEPLYLQAQRGALPELKRVILSLADRVEMGTDLDATLAQLVQGAQVEAARDAATTLPLASAAAGTPTGSPARHALELLRTAEAAVQRGDWVAHGQAMQELRRYLENAAQPATP